MDPSRQFIGKEAEYSTDRWERTSKGSTYRGLDVVAKHPKFGEIGRMSLKPHPDGGHEIHDVNSLFKGAGIATGMYRHAQADGLDPVHSEERTDEGDRWANKVGGKIPPRNDWRGKDDVK